ncbi:hypothetical protein Bca52824_046213 [Brassica carinata]|uniref:FKB95-like N-terminal Kelch domain-containing protein n=1 Tax=Brassica carinata TaxID=52824 RepID=A0A8X7RCF9_BRACI|nr:hypothetical protein Bca52824_046213 [Brassica carinata]
MDRSLAASVGSEIYFLWKHLRYPSDLWILDTRSGKLSLGPSMKAVLRSEAVGVIDGKIYVMGFDRFEDLDEKIQIYMVKAGGISVYNPREGEGERMVRMVSKRLAESNPREGRRKEKLDEAVSWVCVVENVLYACYCSSGLMWFDTKLNVWRRVVSRYAEEACHFVGEKILGTIEWSGIVATVPYGSQFLHCSGIFEDLDEKIQYVFDPKSKIWKSEGQEKVPPRKWYNNTYNIASLERKIYMVKAGGISVYNPREGEGERMVRMVSKRLAESNPREGRRKEKLDEAVSWVCVVENVLYACYCSSGLMWFDTKLNVWRRVVSRYAEEACHFGEQQAVAEYEGKLAVLSSLTMT